MYTAGVTAEMGHLGPVTREVCDCVCVCVCVCVGGGGGGGGGGEFDIVALHKWMVCT